MNSGGNGSHVAGEKKFGERERALLSFAVLIELHVALGKKFSERDPCALNLTRRSRHPVFAFPTQMLDAIPGALAPEHWRALGPSVDPVLPGLGEFPAARSSRWSSPGSAFPPVLSLGRAPLAMGNHIPGLPFSPRDSPCPSGSSRFLPFPFIMLCYAMFSIGIRSH